MSLSAALDGCQIPVLSCGKISDRLEDLLSYRPSGVVGSVKDTTKRLLKSCESDAVLTDFPADFVDVKR